MCRGLITWRDNGGTRWIAAGTHTKLYVMSDAGVRKEITPTGLAGGIANASNVTGYGYSTYGNYAYGVARPDTGNTIPATTWSFDTWGEYLIACSSTDGMLYEWQLGFTTPTLAARITNSPAGNKAVLVTAERIMFALGSGGNPRKVSWSDQEDNTVWTPAGNNLAGDYEPWRGPQFSDVRIVKSIYAPRFKFSFKVTDAAGKTVKEGNEDIRDLAFDMRLTLDRQDPLRFEKDILKDWISSTLSAQKG
jgi:hypothetical protein